MVGRVSSRLMRTRLGLIALALVLNGCAGDTADIGRSTTTTSTTSVTLTTVTPTTATKTTLGPPAPVTHAQVVGRWRVTASVYGAAFSAGDQLAFLDDGSFSLNGAGLYGTWRVMLSVLVLRSRTVNAAYAVSFIRNDMELSLPDGSMTLTRVAN